MKKGFFEAPRNKGGGVYMLYNITKNKAYIGETKNFNSRAYSHRQRLEDNKHTNRELQEDYNNDCEFAFAILEETGEDCDRFWREKQYILSFLDKGIDLYNHETKEQIMYGYYCFVVRPEMDEIYRGFHKKFGCELLSLKRCNTNTIKNKFRNSDKK